MGVFNSDFVIASIVFLLRFISIIIFAKVLLTELANDHSFVGKDIPAIENRAVHCIFFMVLQMIFGLKISVEANFISPYYMNPNIDSVEGIRYPSYFQDPQKFAQFIAAISFLFLLWDEKKPRTIIVNLVLLPYCCCCRCFIQVDVRHFLD